MCGFKIVAPRRLRRQSKASPVELGIATSQCNPRHTERIRLASAKRFYLEISSDMANLERVSDFVLDMARQSNLSEQITDHVQMAVDEAVTNVMEHAYGGRTDGKIAIECRVTADELQIEIRDRGEPFDPDTIREPNIHSPLSERTIGGLGVFFMRKLMDHVEFSHTRRGNLTRMTKKLA